MIVPLNVRRSAFADEGDSFCFVSDERQRVDQLTAEIQARLTAEIQARSKEQ